MAEHIAHFVFQVGIIIIAAHIGGRLAKRVGIPSVLGEVLTGIVIGPYALGAVALPGFPHGLFAPGEDFPVSMELYGFSQIAAILLLFLVGIETDLDKLKKYSVAGTVVGTGGALVSFALADVGSVLFYRLVFGESLSFLSPQALFLGVVSAATSVGITARLLSENRRVDSPEGVTILSAAVLDDILGVLLLTLVLGLAEAGSVDWGSMGAMAGRAFVAMVLLVVVGMMITRRYERLMERLVSPPMFAIISLAVAMIVAAALETIGLAMIIGAYLMGLVISQRKATFDVQTHLAGIYKLFVPVFFCVMGMLADLRPFLDGKLVAFGVFYTAVAVGAKMLGTGFPLLFMNYTGMGALRVGLGMIPRGEVALIVAGVGLASGFMDKDTFAAAMMMTVLTTLITPFFLLRAIQSPKPTLKASSGQEIPETQSLFFDIPSTSAGNFIHQELLRTLRDEECTIHLLDLDERIYLVQKYGTTFAIDFELNGVRFDFQEEDKPYITTVMYEVLSGLEEAIAQVRKSGTLDQFRQEMVQKIAPPAQVALHPHFSLNPKAVSCHLRSQNREEVLGELTDLLVESGEVTPEQRHQIVAGLLEREAAISTGLQHGVAFPHCKTDAVNNIHWAVGVHKKGIDFGSLDGSRTSIFILVVTPKSNPGDYLQFLATMSKFLSNPRKRKAIRKANRNDKLYKIVTE